MYAFNSLMSIHQCLWKYIFNILLYLFFFYFFFFISSIHINVDHVVNSYSHVSAINLILLFFFLHLFFSYSTTKCYHFVFFFYLWCVMWLAHRPHYCWLQPFDWKFLPEFVIAWRLAWGMIKINDGIIPLALHNPKMHQEIDGNYRYRCPRAWNSNGKSICTQFKIYSVTKITN